MKDKNILYIAVAVIFMAGIGIGTGFLFHNMNLSSSNSSNEVLSEATNQNVASDMFASDADAEGTLQENDGPEGTHKLERSGQEPVYLLSTVIGLDSFVGKKVQVWGNTISSTEVDWLMDVGRVKILK